MLIKFTGSWTHGSNTNSNDIFSLTYDSNGDVVLAPATADQIALATSTLSPDNNLMYNDGEAVTLQKDYMVINKNCSYQTAWSRANHWVNIKTINKVEGLIPNYDFTEIKNKSRTALRPIIEFDYPN